MSQASQFQPINMRALVLCNSGNNNSLQDIDDLIERNNKITQVNFEYFSVLRDWLRNLDIKTYHLQDKKDHPSNKVLFLVHEHDIK
jgi:hypothetical protein